jgi:phage anti-repressor protein
VTATARQEGASTFIDADFFFLLVMRTMTEGVTIEVPANVIERIADNFEFLERVRIQKKDPAAGKSWAFSPYMQSFRGLPRPNKSPAEIGAMAIQFILKDKTERNHDDSVVYRLHLDCRNREGKVFYRYAEIMPQMDEEDNLSFADTESPIPEQESTPDGAGALFVLERILKSLERQVTNQHQFAMQKDRAHAEQMERIVNSTIALIEKVPQTFDRAIALMTASHEKSETMLEIAMAEKIAIAESENKSKNFREGIETLKQFGPKILDIAQMTLAARLNSGKSETKKPKPAAVKVERSEKPETVNVTIPEEIVNAEMEAQQENTMESQIQEPLNIRISATIKGLDPTKIIACKEILGDDVMVGLIDEDASIDTAKDLAMALFNDRKKLMALNDVLEDDVETLVELAMEAMKYEGGNSEMDSDDGE